MSISTVFVDLDDTLIPNAYSYYIPQLDAAKLICLDLLWHAPSPATIIKRATELQLEKIKKDQKIGKENFPLSYLVAYNEFCSKASRAPNPNIQSAIVMAAQKFFLKEYSLFPNVKETLTRIHQAKILFTRGDFDIQSYKIENTGLAPYFDYIEIVDMKNVDTYYSLLNKYELVANECAMVGDSILNDVKPALKVGMHVFHVHPRRDDWETAYETEDGIDEVYIELQAFEEILVHLD